jgi:hypothetical protein
MSQKQYRYQDSSLGLRAARRPVTTTASILPWYPSHIDSHSISRGFVNESLFSFPATCASVSSPFPQCVLPLKKQKSLTVGVRSWGVWGILSLCLIPSIPSPCQEFHLKKKEKKKVDKKPTLEPLKTRAKSDDDNKKTSTTFPAVLPHFSVLQEQPDNLLPGFQAS